MPPTIDPGQGQILQPLPQRNITRQVGEFEAARQQATRAAAATPTALSRLGRVPTAGPTATTAVARPAASPPSPPDPRQRAQARSPAALPAQLELAERNRIPGHLYQLLNETRGRDELASQPRVLANLLETGRQEQYAEAAVAFPVDAALPDVRFSPAGPETTGEEIPVQPPATGPIRELPELGAPRTTGIALALETGADLERFRATEALTAAVREQALREAGGVGSPTIARILIDETV